VPRFRNSIAVSSFEHFRSGNKRPHSLLSVASDSSSSSGGSQLLAGAGSCSLPPLSATIESPLESTEFAASAPSVVAVSKPTSAVTSSLRVQLTTSCTGTYEWQYTGRLPVVDWHILMRARKALNSNHLQARVSIARVGSDSSIRLSIKNK
jgi:hypothetical protein